MKCKFFVAALGLVLATALSAMAGPAVTGGLVFYYSFDDIATGTDVIVNDGSGNDMDGKVVTAASTGQTSAITFIPGVYGNCAHFACSAPDDSANNDYACIEIANCWDTAGEPDPIGLDGDSAYPNPSSPSDCYAYDFQSDGDEPSAADIPTDAMTLALWVNTEAKTVGDTTQSTFCASAYDPDKGPSGGLGNARAAWPYHLEVKNDAIRYTIRYDGGTGPGTGDGSAYGMKTIVSENPVLDQYGNTVMADFGTWTHIAWVYSQSQGKWWFYKNGEVAGEGPAESAQPIYDNWDNGALLGLNPDIARQFVGDMDEVYMFKRALSASEIATLAEYPGLQGDLNGDGFVNSGDLDLVRANWGTSNSAGDANDDGIVNSSDLDIIRGNWGAHTAASVVPEPTTLVLLGALSLLACLIRKR